MSGDTRWGIQISLAVLGLIIALAGVVAAFVVPEGRCFLRLDVCGAVPATQSTSKVTYDEEAPVTRPSLTAVSAPASSTSTIEPIEGLGKFHQFTHDESHVGTIWINIVPDPANNGKYHEIHIVWGGVEYKNSFLVQDSLSLVHEKTRYDAIPLDVHIEPAARVEFGESNPPGDEIVDIKQGWTNR